MTSYFSSVFWIRRRQLLGETLVEQKVTSDNRASLSHCVVFDVCLLGLLDCCKYRKQKIRLSVVTLFSIHDSLEKKYAPEVGVIDCLKHLCMTAEAFQVMHRLKHAHLEKGAPQRIQDSCCNAFPPAAIATGKDLGYPSFSLGELQKCRNNLDCSSAKAHGSCFRG